MRSLPVGLVNDDMTGPPDMTTRIVWMLLDVVVAEVWNAGEVARLSEVYDRDYLGHFAPRRVPVSGPAELAQLVVTVRRAFPDLRVVVGDVVGGRSAFAARFVVRGTQTGRFAGTEPSGRQVTVTGLVLATLDDSGRIAEEWVICDALALLGPFRRR
jgi:predicted ester cyclase